MQGFRVSAVFALHLGHARKIDHARGFDGLVVKVELADRFGSLVEVVEQSELGANRER
jgi:hypothetical protein